MSFPGRRQTAASSSAWAVKLASGWLRRYLGWLICAEQCTSNTSAANASPRAMVMYTLHLCSTKALRTNSESSFGENEEPH